MDMQQLKEFIRERVQKYQLYIGGVALFLCILIGYVFWNKTNYQEQNFLEEPSVMVSEEISQADTITSQEPEWIYVDIKGEVNHPGVYQVDTDCRLIDLIDKAGGLTNKANQELINLAQKLNDQAMIMIPSIEDQPTNSEAETQANGIQQVIVQGNPVEVEGKININTAAVEELTELTGIGVKKAQQIIDYREEHGSFKKVEDLVNVSGIGEKTVDKLKDEVCVQ